MNLSSHAARAADSLPRRSRWPGVLLGLTTTLAIAAAIGTASWIETREAAQDARDVASTEAVIVRRMEVYIAQLRAAAALFDVAGETLDRERFARFAAGLRLGEYPGIQGIGWVPRLDREAAERAVRDAKPEGRGELALASDSDEHFPILYLEPLDERNRAALGFDMYTNPVRRAAMERARDAGAPTLSGRVRLVQEIEGPVQAGFLIYVPVYRGGEIPSALEERRERLLGFAYAPFRARDLFDAILAEEGRDVDVEVFDDGSLDEEDRLYGVAPPEGSSSEVVRLTIAGHPWTLRITTREHGVTTSLGAAAIVGLIGIAFGLAAHRAARGESEARLRAEQALAREAREAQFREMFLGMLGHDLRNPLQAILMSARMLLMRDGSADSTESRALERIVTSTSRANRMVSQLLDMTRARVGEGLAIRREPLDLAAFTRDAVSELRAAHPEREIEIDVDEGDELLHVRGDPDRLAQVLGNLGSNAITHGDPTKPVRFRARRLDPTHVTVEVWNGSAPIPDGIVAFLFDPFSRGKTGRAGKSEGLGLGLYIGDQIARAHGGRLELVTNDERGITFGLVLPQ